MNDERLMNLRNKRRYLKITDPSNFRELDKAFQAYREYILSIRNDLPKDTYEFAIADWHYDPATSQCPHDSWLESLSLSESINNTQSDKRINIDLLLLGAYHDGNISLRYEGVVFYELEKILKIDQEIVNEQVRRGTHGDWLIDEISLSDGGVVIHDIEFANDARWIICCENIIYEWIPFTQANSM